MIPESTMTSDLMTAAAELWPGSEVVRADVPPDGRPVRARYAVLARGAVPKMLVPVEPSTAASASLRRASGADGLRGSVQRAAAGAAVSAAPGLLRQRVEVRGGENGLDELIGSVLGEAVSFSVSIGTARVNRKPVLQVFDRTGRCRAFGKVGWAAHTCADVEAEGRALAAIGGRRFDHLVPPALLARTRWEGRPVLLTAPLVPRGWRTLRVGRSSWKPPTAAMRELNAHFAETPAPLLQAPWWARQWQEVGRLADVVTRGRLARAMEQVAQLAGDRPLAWGAWHGDWTPWNMASDGHRTLLWDWERFETGVPAGLDAVHYVLNVATAGAPATADKILQGLHLAVRGGGWPEGERELTVRLYLVAILVRYLRLVAVPGGEHIAPRAAQVLIALERLSAG